MMLVTRMRLFLIVLAMFLAACQRGETPVRCGKCGMAVGAHPRWIAGVTHDDGREQLFCSPKCLTHWIEQERWSGPAWVTDYYTQERVALDEVLFIDGSDVTGPMGAAWVPVRGIEAARQFLEDHLGESIFRRDGTKVESPARR